MIGMIGVRRRIIALVGALVLVGAWPTTATAAPIAADTVAATAPTAADTVATAADTVATAVGSAVTTVGGTVTRLAGGNRYETSAAISSASFSPGIGVAYVATGSFFPDALSAGARAGADGAPVLLTSSGSLSPATAAELTRLKPQRIVIIGGPEAVSSAVQTSLGRFTSGAVTRLDGATRYATSAAVSATFSPGVAVAYLASGTTYPDALAGAAAAGRDGAPVLLTAPDALSDAVRAELKRLKPKKIVVVGGEQAVSQKAAAAAASVTGAALHRLGGADRYETAAAISAGTAGQSIPVAYVATGSNYPDALSGAAVAAAQDAPLLLTKSTGLPTAVRAELKRLNPARIVVLGGTEAVASTVADLLDAFATSRTAAKGATLTVASEVRAGTCLTAAAGGAKFCLDAKKGLTLTGATRAWSLAVSGGSVLRLRADGDLVLYSSTGVAVWQTRTSGSSSTTLRVQDDGDVTLRTSGGKLTWATLTAAASPQWGLPFEGGQQWVAGGPHVGTSSNANQTRNALDLGASSKSTSTRVVTIAAGRVIKLSCGNGSFYLGVTHGNGWESAYYHLRNVQSDLIGTTVPAGTYLGDVGRAVPCGGSATFDHVHLSIRHEGTPVSVEAMSFGGFTVYGAEAPTSGRWVDAAGKTVITTSRGAACCLQAPSGK